MKGKQPLWKTTITLSLMLFWVSVFFFSREQLGPYSYRLWGCIAAMALLTLGMTTGMLQVVSRRKQLVASLQAESASPEKA